MIGVTITTHNRRDVFEECIGHWLNHRPDDCKIVVVDDGSDVPVPSIPGVTVIRHDYPKGVAMAKNAGIAALVDAGADHIWLSDDDLHPVTDDWWRPYVESPEPHLSFQWGNPPGRRNREYEIVYDDGQHFAIRFPRGVLMYMTREVVETVGGMDIAYGRFGGEHFEYSRRIHQAGLTRWPYADVCGSDQLWHSRDKEDGATINSSLPQRERSRICKLNGLIEHKQRPTFMPYREGEGVPDYQLGPKLSDSWTGVLEHALALKPFGTAVEFGTATGGTARLIAAHMPVVTFGSLDGLPEDWRPGFGKGAFAHPAPDLPANATFVEGLFEDTLPGFDFAALGPIGLVHLDADLESATRTALEHIGPHLLPGTYVVFDEWHGFPGAGPDAHEQKAWREFADHAGIGWTVVGCGPEQWCIRIA